MHTIQHKTMHIITHRQHRQHTIIPLKYPKSGEAWKKHEIKARWN